MGKLELLNSFDVEDFSCSGSELDYVLAQLTCDDFEKLYTAGFTEKQVRDALGDYPNDMLIDLSMLALNCCDEVYWSEKTGFVEEPQA